MVIKRTIDKETVKDLPKAAFPGQIHVVQTPPGITHKDHGSDLFIFLGRLDSPGFDSRGGINSPAPRVKGKKETI